MTSTPSDKNEKRSKFNIQLHTDKRVYQISAETQEEQRSWFVVVLSVICGQHHTI